ncbi:hypothetical protein AAFF_G00060200 [Aldrovandia affinis]|uniref:Reverse transcriptase/retrotransposon-derived protein RNase H-like domain-containing protein n=1 Tax=Aldrovandia affinis TaxID=143900 RepID=A0AAD7S0H6_9TELE|nr:hypothetical protein AAFF_G00060200 [Aldrovandia affinis]
MAQPEKALHRTDRGMRMQLINMHRGIHELEQVSSAPGRKEPASPLWDLLTTKNMWTWGDAQQRAFDSIKKELCTPPGLVLYNSKADAVVSSDASSHGLGAVLLQRQEGGQLKPVTYAFRGMHKFKKRH